MKNSCLLQFITFLLFCSLIANAQTYEPMAATEAMNRNGKKILLIADNQEHLLTGTRLRSMSPTTEALFTSVALRSPLANAGGRQLMAEALRFGKKEGASIALHLGDASDISCPEELETVFKSLEKEFPEHWFLAPGNHDGILAGTLAEYQPKYKFSVPQNIFEKAPIKGHKGSKTWLNACVSPSNLNSNNANILTTGDAIRLYTDELAKRKDAKITLLNNNPVYFGRKKGREVWANCAVKEIQIPYLAYKAIYRICERTPVSPGSQKWKGPYASYIVQKFDVSGTRFVLMDTSYYENPSLFEVALKGSIPVDEQEVAKSLFDGIERERVIIAGHHHFQSLQIPEQRWINSKAGRYLSAHIHRSSQLIEHKIDAEKLLELNVGSVLDYPSQAIIADLSDSKMFFQVAGADFVKTGWKGFLEPCHLKSDIWKLDDEFYQNYRRGNYIKHLIKSLTEAVNRHNKVIESPNPAYAVPSGKEIGDWRKLNDLLNGIKWAEGESGLYWACQAYYASEATVREKSFLERAAKLFHKMPRSGKDAVGEKFPFN